MIKSTRRVGGESVELDKTFKDEVMMNRPVRRGAPAAYTSSLLHLQPYPLATSCSLIHLHDATPWSTSSARHSTSASFSQTPSPSSRKNDSSQKVRSHPFLHREANPPLVVGWSTLSYTQAQQSANAGFGNVPHDPYSNFGGSGGDEVTQQGIKQRLIALISAVRTLMRSE